MMNISTRMTVGLRAEFFFTVFLQSKSAHRSDVRLPFLGLLSFLHPVVQQLQDDLFHLLDREGFREVLSQGIMA